MKYFSFLRFLLYPFALIYGVLIWLRNRLYDSGFFSSIAFSIPVISVGNLSVGGTGKTPHVEYLIRLLQYQYRTATLSRGYKRRTQGFLIAEENTNALKIGDEPMQYFLKYPDNTVCVAEERMTAIPQLLQKRPYINVIVMDDAFQHRSVRPSVNILITDYSRPFYTDYILPYGRLRESRRSYKRADIIIVSKCPEHISEEEQNKIARKIGLHDQQLFFTYLSYGSAYSILNKEVNIKPESRILLITGIENPAPLKRHLEKKGSNIHLLQYADHYYFGSKDLEEIEETFLHMLQDGPVSLVTTEKDAARLLLFRDLLVQKNLNFLALPVEIKFMNTTGNNFDQYILNQIEQTIGDNQLDEY